MINVLDRSVFNLIAAGEVVERPSSVAKELVENSIDAGATEIEIEVLSGGRECIKVADNGTGILREDLAKAFLPHATSKVASAKDLESIGTLGFRGEALSSISAVSKVTVTSKTPSDIFGAQMTISGGVMSDIVDAGCPQGTSIKVEEIFYNVPARAKFLKSIRSENIEFSNLISKLMLSNPFISFKYINDQSVVYRSDGTGLESAILAIYGTKTLELLEKVSATVSDIVVEGYVGSPELARPTRTHQTLVINGRYVFNTTVSRAVFDAFGISLMKNQYPFFVLAIKLPYDKLDVNVHPNKLDVRFSDGNLIYRAVRSAVADAVQRFSPPQIVLASGEGFSPSTLEEASDQILPQGKPPIVNFSETVKAKGIDFSKGSQPMSASSSEVFSDLLIKMQQEITQIQKANTSTQYTWGGNEQSPKIVEKGSGFLEKTKQVGVLFNTYLLAESGDDVFLIDQHAAHERLLYDKFKERLSTSLSVQTLLVPYVFDISSANYDTFSSNLELMREIGFSIEPLSAMSFKISAVPAVLTGIRIKDFVNLLIDDKSIFASKASDLAKDKIARHACRAAVKGGDVLSYEDMDELLKQFSQSQSLQCPHGRPIVLKLGRKEIEKWFKRIV